jgi:hypothetical protein
MKGSQFLVGQNAAWGHKTGCKGGGVMLIWRRVALWFFCGAVLAGLTVEILSQTS